MTKRNKNIKKPIGNVPEELPIPSDAAKENLGKQIYNILRKINLKTTIGVIVGIGSIVGVIYGIKTYYDAKKPLIADIQWTTSKCTFFVPKDLSNSLKIQFETYFYNSSQAFFSFRPMEAKWFYKDRNDSLTFYTISDKQLRLEPGQSKMLTFLCNLDFDSINDEVNVEIRRKMASKLFSHFSLEIINLPSTSFTADLKVDENTTSLCPVFDTINSIGDSSIQVLILQMPPTINEIVIQEKDIKQTVWLETEL